MFIFIILSSLRYSITPVSTLVTARFTAYSSLYWIHMYMWKNRNKSKWTNCLNKLNESGLFGLVSLQIARRHKTLPRKKLFRLQWMWSAENRILHFPIASLWLSVRKRWLAIYLEHGKLFWEGNYWPESATIPQQAPLQNEPVKWHVMKKEGVRLNKKQMKCEQHIV